VNQHQKELAHYRLARAHETIEDARLLLERGRLPAAANRIYYATFYAATALLITKGLSSSRHTGIISLFHREFVKTREFPSDLAQFIDVAFDERLESDYGDYVRPERIDLERLLVSAGQFVAKAEELVRTAD
jgi:uncharacterized protein (UPF0332 family)